MRIKMILIVMISFAVSMLLHAECRASRYMSVAVFNYTTSVRSYGMGNTGVTAWGDPTNAYANPANSAFLRRIYATGFYGSLMPQYVDDVYVMSSGLAGGFSRRIGDGIEFSIGGGFHYGRLDWGECEYLDLDLTTIRTTNPLDQYLNINGAFGVTIHENIHAALGFAIKPVWIKTAPRWAVSGEREPKGDAVAFDLGATFGIDLFPGGDMSLTPAIGFSYLNLGSDVSFHDGGPGDQLPENVRFGCGLTFSSAGMPELEEKLGVETPYVAAAANFDIIDYRLDFYDNDKTVLATGCEVAVLQMLFLRAGYHKDDDGGIDDATWGIGLGVTHSKFTARFDYARYPQASTLDSVNRYGLLFGIAF